MESCACLPQYCAVASCIKLFSSPCTPPTTNTCTVHCAGSIIGTATGLGFRQYQLVPVRGRPGKKRLKTTIQLPSNGPSTPGVTQNLFSPEVTNSVRGSSRRSTKQHKCHNLQAVVILEIQANLMHDQHTLMQIMFTASFVRTPDTSSRRS